MEPPKEAEKNQMAHSVELTIWTSCASFGLPPPAPSLIYISRAKI